MSGSAAGFTAPKGTFDLLPPRSAVFTAVRDGLAAPVRRAGYGYVETPAFEDTALFARGVGASTDIVSKEMYTFTTRGGQSLTLRPEGTAGVLRAVLEHGLHRGALPVKLWYAGSYYRYERPQAGRYRHFSQVGAEALGVEDPAIDAELVVLAADAFRDLGLTGVRLLLNSLGCRECRPGYRSRLQAFLRGLDLDEETRQRVDINPLRVLDDKRPEVQRQLVGAPLVVDSLCEACRAHHDAVRTMLADVGVTWQDEPRLVRGLDYYTRTTFEFVHDGLGSQSAVGGGGRYDGLSEEIGGPPLPGVGWALGVDRTVLALDAEGIAVPHADSVEVFGVPLGAEAERVLFGIVSGLRRSGVSADLAYGGRSVKGAMKAADRSGARYALVLGERDLAEGAVQLKNLESGDQRPIPIDDAVALIEAELTTPSFLAPEKPS
jgi:histidyl-tRNA synthetase